MLNPADILLNRHPVGSVVLGKGIPVIMGAAVPQVIP